MYPVKNIRLPLVMVIILFCAGFTNAKASVQVDNLTVEYTTTPIGIDVAAPRFGWQMVAPLGERGCVQTAWQIIVKDETGKQLWNTNKTPGNAALGITYAGLPLTAATRYFWTVTIWDQKGSPSTRTSWFETGLMNPNPDLSAWGGATWIGGSNDDMVLYAHYLPIFRLKYGLTIAPGSTRASIILAANDSRLMDKNKNNYQLQKGQNESYFKIELDIAALGTSDTGRATLNIYRVGYTNTDVAGLAYKTFQIKQDYINNSNKNKEHLFNIKDEYGRLTFNLDGSDMFYVQEPATQSNVGFTGFPGAKSGAVVNLNPMGAGHDYITFGFLCDIGFSVDAGQQASVANLSVSNTRSPQNTLFSEDLAGPQYAGIFQSLANKVNSGLLVRNGAYQLFGGTNGLFITADPSHNAMPLLRTKFTTGNKKIAGARLYVTARGIYEIYINGKRVGNDYYNPGLTQYNITHFYQTYDVTAMVANGQNAMGAMLGEGWWSGLLSFGAIWNHFGDRQSLLAKLVVKYTDGTTSVITTNNHDWKYYNKGPIVYSSLDMGEVYDAGLEAAIKNWSTTAFYDKNWHPAVNISLDGTSYTGGMPDFMGVKDVFNFDNLSLVGQIGESAGVYRTLIAKSIKEVRKGVYVYNLGQNIVGVPKIVLRNGKAGQKITVRYAEVLYPALKESGSNVGMIMTENYRAALSEDRYTMKDGLQVFQPHFTSHGFQYIEVTGIEAPLPLADVQGVSISSITKLSANYNTSNEKVNKLWSNLVWSNVDNFLTIPTDCPQRNERMGWSGDISIFSRTATYISNADQFLKRHMVAMRNLQTAKGKFPDIAPVGGGFGGVLWGSAGITVAWETYQQYKDSGLLAEHYNAMAAYMAYVDSTINKETGLSTDNQLGDWLGPQNNTLGQDFLITAYHVFDLGIMAKMAAILNKTYDATFFMERYKERKAFFNKTFVGADKKTIGLIGVPMFVMPGTKPPKPVFKPADTQTSYAVGLALDAFSEENKPFMVKNLADAVERENIDDNGVRRPKYSLMTGFIGTAWISKALSDNGYSLLAYKLLQNDQYPSWLYAVQQGATTIWERLNGYTLENGFGGNNSMNSFNHYSFGAIGQWMMAYSLGIQRDEPGFQKFILQPEPDPTGEMTWAKGYYDSPFGRISSSWKTGKGLLTYSATVPANSTATLYLPTASPETVLESGKAAAEATGVTFVKLEKGKAVYTLQPGTYTFVTKQ